MPATTLLDKKNKIVKRLESPFVMILNRRDIQKNESSCCNHFFQTVVCVNIKNFSTLLHSMLLIEIVA